MKTYEKLSLSALLLFSVLPALHCQTVEKINVIDNGIIKRNVVYSNGTISTKGLFLNDIERSFVRNGSSEFRFLMNDQVLTGNSGWKLVSSNDINDQSGGKGVSLVLKGNNISAGIELTLSYLSYPGLPVVRKWITFRNNSGSSVKLESIDIESLDLDIDYVSTWVYHNYARMKHLGTYIGNWDDPVVVVHNTTLRSGIALGNEAPGVLKRTAFHTTDRNADIGLTHKDQDFPFRKWLSPGETWESPKTFIALYSGSDDGYEVVNTVVNDFVRNYLGTRLSSIKEKPLFVYNTWNPFRTFINDSLIRDVARAAAECGIQEFIIDDGWEYNSNGNSSKRGWGENYGDWLVDRYKFSGGLTPVFDYIRSLGMKPGLWISIGSATADSKVFQTHPEWFIRTSSGKPGNNHTASNEPEFFTSCFGTDWFDYIKSVILNLVKEHGLAYAKLDLSVVASAYINDPAISGCYAKDHPYHRDHEESFIVIYQRVLRLFDDLHAEAPELFIDCTFETMGKLQLQDYACVQHAEGNWLSNIEEPFPTGALRMRQLAWWRSPALPAGSLVIGNLPLDSKNLEFDLKSLIGTLPIVLGDPRKLPLEKRSEIKKWADWMKIMQDRYDYMSFRQDLSGFGEPKEGAWDGWSRINTEKRNGGIIGIFRHGSHERIRRVTVSGLEPSKTYLVLQAPEGSKITEMTGEELANQGFPVELKDQYDGSIFEIRDISLRP